MYYIWEKAEFIPECHYLYGEVGQAVVRTLLAGKWTQLEKNVKKWPIFKGFRII